MWHIQHHSAVIYYNTESVSRNQKPSSSNSRPESLGSTTNFKGRWSYISFSEGWLLPNRKTLSVFDQAKSNKVYLKSDITYMWQLIKTKQLWILMPFKIIQKEKSCELPVKIFQNKSCEMCCTSRSINENVQDLETALDNWSVNGQASQVW